MQIEETKLNQSDVYFTDGAVMNQVLGGEAIYESEYSSQSGGRGLEVIANLGVDPYSSYEMSRDAADIIFSNSMIARRAVNVLPDKAFSLLKSWEAADSKNNKGVNKLMQVWRKKLLLPLIEAGQMARKYQDAYVVLFFDDTDKLDTPLSPSTATKLVGAIAKSRWSVNPVQGYPGTAEYYTVTSNYGDKFILDSSLKNVHHSRIIHIPGLMVDDEQRKLRQGYSMSVFNYLLEPLSQWINSNHSGIAMLNSHSAFKLGLSGLAWRTSNKDINGLKSRFASILAGLKRVGGLFYDKDMESADFISRSYGGVDKLLEQLEGYLLNASDIPKEFLLNSSDSPYSESGLGSRYAMAAVVEAYSRTHVTPIVDRIFPILAEVYNISLAGDKEFYEPLYDSAIVFTRQEEAEIRFKNSQSDAIYLNAAPVGDEVVLNAESVRSRWETGHYSDEITLSGDFRLPTPEEAPQTQGLKKEAVKMATSASRGAYTVVKKG